MRRNSLFSLLLAIYICFIFLSACSKKHDEVNGNQAPPDQTVDSIVIQNYLNRIYITLLGRKATSSEYQIGIKILNVNNFSESSRKNFIDQVFTKPDYTDNLYTIARNEFLNGLDTSEVSNGIGIYQSELNKPANAAYKDDIQKQINLLYNLRNVTDDLHRGKIDVIEMYKRIVFNNFYDDINMGSANFVISLFQNFLFRYPSNEEENAGVNMVDNKASVAFNKNGSNKATYLDIFFDSPDYYEGQVRYYYKKYLFREPTSSEASVKTLSYAKDHNYRNLQKNILSTNEYAGF